MRSAQFSLRPINPCFFPVCLWNKQASRQPCFALFVPWTNKAKETEATWLTIAILFVLNPHLSLGMGSWTYILLLRNIIMIKYINNKTCLFPCENWANKHYKHNENISMWFEEIERGRRSGWDAKVVVLCSRFATTTTTTSRSKSRKTMSCPSNLIPIMISWVKTSKVIFIGKDKFSSSAQYWNHKKLVGDLDFTWKAGGSKN